MNKIEAIKRIRTLVQSAKSASVQGYIDGLPEYDHLQIGGLKDCKDLVEGMIADNVLVPDLTVATVNRNTFRAEILDELERKLGDSKNELEELQIRIRSVKQQGEAIQTTIDVLNFSCQKFKA